jgi:general secretion pathway protein A
VSDPGSTHWLADDPRFLESLGDLDRGLAGGDDPVEPAPTADRAAIAAVRAPVADPRADAPPRTAPRSPGSAAARGAPTAPPAPPPAAASPLAPEIVSETNDDALPAFLFTRRTPGEPPPRRPMLDLFPPASLQPEAPIAAGGAAVGPQRQRSRPAPSRQAGSPVDALTYESFYGLDEKPFGLSTDPRFHYQSASHERAGQQILAAIRARLGPAVLTAPPGMGKTTLCRSLIAELDRRTVTSLVLDPIHSMNDLLKTMLVDFGVIAREDLAAAANVSRDVLLGALNSFLESLAGLEAGAVLFLDEAQNLPVPLLADLAVVAGAPAARVLQLVLVGQPALTTVLKHRDVRALSALVRCRTRLAPLAAGEISGYVTHRLAIAGANTRVEFDEAAIAQLFELSAGSPRMVNLLCDLALTRGYAASAAVIDLPLIEAAANDLDLEWPEPDRPGRLASLAIVVMFALLVIAGGGGAAWVFRDAVDRTVQQWENVPLPPGGPIRRLPVPLAPIPPPAGSDGTP